LKKHDQLVLFPAEKEPEDSHDGIALPAIPNGTMELAFKKLLSRSLFR
jgi:hypothetical protein